MASDIELKIYMPEKLVLNTHVHRVVLPLADGNRLTVMKDRAPTLLSLNMGQIFILDTNNEIIEEWLVADGAADIKEDTCTVLTEAAFNKKDLSLEKAKELNEEFKNPFYLWLIKFFEQEQRK